MDATAGQSRVTSAVSVVNYSGHVGASVPVEQAQVALGDDVLVLSHVGAGIHVHARQGHAASLTPAPFIPAVSGVLKSVEQTLLQLLIQHQCDNYLFLPQTNLHERDSKEGQAVRAGKGLPIVTLYINLQK